MKKLKTIFTFDALHLYLIWIFILLLTFRYPIFIIGLIYIRYKSKALIPLKSIFILTIIVVLSWFLYFRTSYVLNIGIITEVYDDKYEILIGHKRYHLYTNVNLARGNIVYLRTSFKSYPGKMVPNGFDAKTFYFGRNIHGKLYASKINLIFSSQIPNVKKIDHSILTLYQSLFYASILYYTNKIAWHFNLDDRQKIKAEVFVIITLIFFLGTHYYLIYYLIYQSVKRMTNYYYWELNKDEITNLTFTVILIIFPFYIYQDGFLLFFLIKIMMQLKPNQKYLSETLLIPFLLKWNQQISIINLIVLSIYRKYYKNIFIILILIPMHIRLNQIYPFIQTIETNLLTLKHFKLSIYAFIIYIIMILKIKGTYKSFYLLIACLSIVINPVFLTHNWIVFLDVGQGDGAVIKKNEKIILIDCYYNTYDFLSSNGIKKISYMILSHPDADHIIEAQKIIDHIEVETLVIGGYNDYPVTHPNTIYITKPLEINEIDMQILGPYQDFKSSNDNSIILKIKIKNQYILFTGDIESETELDYVLKYGNKLNAYILKVAHHGSKTSSTEEFLKMVNPTIAIISVADNNRYGMPNPEVIDRLNRLGVRVYRTDLNGSIIYYKQSLYNYQRYRYKRLSKKAKI